MVGLEIPTWEVDIFREGVDDPIMTLTVDRDILPPRKSKKKTVWKLPDNVEITPKFGAQDKKRILDIYKEKKKETKKMMRRASRNISPSGGDPGDDAQDATEGTELSNSAIFATNEAIPSSQGKCNGSHQQKPRDKSNQSSASSSPSPPPGLDSLSLDTTTSTTSERLQNTSLQLSYQNQLPPPPPGMTGPPPPPPGMGPIVHATGTVFADDAASQFSIQMHSNHAPKSHRASTGSVRLPTQSSLPLDSLPPQIQPGGRCFTHPSIAMPRNPSPAALSAMASLVTESYHLLLHRGLINELASYYSMDAQKSLTVGGAYAACASVADRLLQLQSLSGSIKPHIKGVQQQPTLAGGIMVMITGISVRPPAGLLLPFCHTLVLCPVSTITTTTVEGGQPQTVVGYQIQNDNLVFLTADDTILSSPPAAAPTTNGSVAPSENSATSTWKQLD